MGLRRKARELALQALYAIEIEPAGIKKSESFWEAFEAEAHVLAFARELVQGVIANREELDRVIAEKSRNWSLSRMAKIDLNILRLAAYELLHRPDIPKNVTINEAIEIAKIFGTEDSPAFVNGILDEIASGLPDKQ
ncbi:MAG: transcription antitermination factor NusB [Geobacter sp.]|nr:transcription antitermination factor NusB [Geobacter sp.]